MSEPREDPEPLETRETQIAPGYVHVGVSIPEAFGDYEIERPIASGGMGIVFLGWSRSLERPVAIKVLKKEHDPGSEYHERFLREARALARIDHAHVVRVYEVGWIGDLPFLAMEYVIGEDMLARLAREKFLPERLRLFRQILGAVEAMHAVGVIHRDLKPENVMVTTDGQIKIMDFGLARIADGETRLTKTGSTIGTPYYMAPEQFEADPQGIDERSDVYALGVLLYEFLTDRVPYEGPTVAAVYHQILQGQPVPPASISAEVAPDLEQVCLRAMARRPEDRFPSVAAFAGAFAAAMAPTKRWSATGRFARLKARGRDFRPWAPWAVAAVVLAVAAIGITAGIRGRREARIEDLVGRAAEAREAGRFEQAAELLAEARGAGGERHPSVVRAGEALAVARVRSLAEEALRLARAGDLASAGRKEEEAVAAAHGVPSAAGELVELQRELDRLRRSPPVRRPDEAQRLVAEARAVHTSESSDHARMIEILDRAVEADPGLVEARSLRAHCFDSVGRTRDAIDEYGRLVDLDPSGEPTYRNRRGDLFKKLEELGPAEEEYGRAIELAPSTATDSLTERCFLRYRRQAFREAVVDADRVLAAAQAEEKSLRVACWVRALVRIRYAEVDAAVADVEFLEARFPDSYNALHARTFLLLALGDVPGALDSGHRLVTRQSHQAAAHLAYAIACLVAGRLDEAQVQLETAGKRSGGPAFDRDYYYRALGLVAEGRGERDVARGWFEKAKALNPELAEIDADLARVR